MAKKTFLEGLAEGFIPQVTNFIKGKDQEYYQEEENAKKQALIDAENKQKQQIEQQDTQIITDYFDSKKPAEPLKENAPIQPIDKSRIGVNEFKKEEPKPFSDTDLLGLSKEGMQKFNMLEKVMGKKDEPRTEAYYEILEKLGTGKYNKSHLMGFLADPRLNEADRKDLKGYSSILPEDKPFVSTKVVPLSEIPEFKKTAKAQEGNTFIEVIEENGQVKYGKMYDMGSTKHVGDAGTLTETEVPDYNTVQSFDAEITEILGDEIYWSNISGGKPGDESYDAKLKAVEELKAKKIAKSKIIYAALTEDAKKFYNDFLALKESKKKLGQDFAWDDYAEEVREQYGKNGFTASDRYYLLLKGRLDFSHLDAVTRGVSFQKAPTGTVQDNPHLGTTIRK